MSEPYWTYKSPTKEGYYWWKKNNDEPPMLVWLKKGAILLSHKTARKPMNNSGGYWWGPVCEPPNLPPAQREGPICCVCENPSTTYSVCSLHFKENCKICGPEFTGYCTEHTV